MNNYPINNVSLKRRILMSFCAISIALTVVLGSVVAAAAAVINEVTAGNTKEIFVSSEAEGKINVISTKIVVVDNDGETQSYLVVGGTVADVLAMADVQPKTNQIVVPSLSTPITEDTIVYVRNAKPIKVTADGQTRLVVMAYGSVEESLKLADIPLGKDDILSVDGDAKIEDIEKIKIQRVTYQNEKETETITYDSVTQNSDKVELGETKLQTKGENGVKVITKRVKYVDGKRAEEKVVSEKITKQPVDEVTLVGTKGAGTTGGAGTFIDSNGVEVAYSQVLTGSGTAYTAPAGSGTATGVTAYHGGVAVNPNLIPYGSKLYVVSTDGSFVYGYCTAVDTGGALMDGSAIVDCFYDTYNECVNFGRRDVNVYVIA